jgi:N-terminal half of MaoC dehydratase
MPDYSWAERADWPAAWQDLIVAIGQEFGETTAVRAADEVERGLVRRYLEPLEFDCPLHYDDETAKAHGYPGVIAPYSGLATWTSPGQWLPGDEPVYVSAERNAQPRPRGVAFRRPGPDCNGGFVTDVEYEYFHPFLVGERYGIRGRKLLDVQPKQTSVGRGAFLTWESDVTNRTDELIARQRSTSYYYVAMAPETGA